AVRRQSAECERQERRRDRDDQAVHPGMAHSGCVDDRAVVVQCPVPLREAVPPPARGDVVRLAERCDSEPDSRHEPDQGNGDQANVDRRASEETDQALAARLRAERDSLFDGRHQATTFSLRNRRTLRIMTGAMMTNMITATAAP